MEKDSFPAPPWLQLSVLSRGYLLLVFPKEFWSHIDDNSKNELKDELNFAENPLREVDPVLRNLRNAFAHADIELLENSFDYPMGKSKSSINVTFEEFSVILYRLVNYYKKIAIDEAVSMNITSQNVDQRFPLPPGEVVCGNNSDKVLTSSLWGGRRSELREADAGGGNTGILRMQSWLFSFYSRIIKCLVEMIELLKSKFLKCTTPTRSWQSHLRPPHKEEVGTRRKAQVQIACPFGEGW